GEAVPPSRRWDVPLPGPRRTHPLGPGQPPGPVQGGPPGPQLRSAVSLGDQTTARVADLAPRRR
ncbi:DeoR family transcriptional regulator, partial [Streptomyces sp. UNOC14_S4]|nr:DeoR family transcriptional regulator [Streptomyces sp. UNOC14_S4]